jgi:TolB-like protein
MLRVVVACLLSWGLLGCGSTPVSYIHPTADLTYITTVAIVPFKNLTQERGAEGKVANMVAAEVLRRGIFDIVEFGEVIKVLREEGFREDEGDISKNIAERAGKRLNVQAFILGSVQEYGLSRGGGISYPEVSLTLRLVDAKSYKILWEATHSLKGGTVLDRLFGIGKKSAFDISKELVAEMLDTLYGG